MFYENRGGRRSYLHLIFNFLAGFCFWVAIIPLLLTSRYIHIIIEYFILVSHYLPIYTYDLVSSEVI